MIHIDNTDSTEFIFSNLDAISDVLKKIEVLKGLEKFEKQYLRGLLNGTMSALFFCMKILCKRENLDVAFYSKVYLNVFNSLGQEQVFPPIPTLSEEVDAHCGSLEHCNGFLFSLFYFFGSKSCSIVREDSMKIIDRCDLLLKTCFFIRGSLYAEIVKH